MSICATCRNEYDKCFQVTIEGRTYSFDSFECAIQKLAPQCEHCSCRIIGHGVESEGRFFCCAHCAHDEGIFAARDRIDPALPSHAFERSDPKQL